MFIRTNLRTIVPAAAILLIIVLYLQQQTRGEWVAYPSGVLSRWKVRRHSPLFVWTLKCSQLAYTWQMQKDESARRTRSRTQNAHGTSFPRHLSHTRQRNGTIGHNERTGNFKCPVQLEQREHDELSDPPQDPSELHEWAVRANNKLVIFNEDLFGPLEDTPIQYVILVQTHSRPNYLRWLLHSLSNIHGIDSVLLVLSHDRVDDDLVALGREVCFCRVIRVFFPHSMQMWPGQFPGDDCQASDSRKCQRDAKATMAKHHWWWLHNWAFSHISALIGFSEPTFLFLEEDMFLSPDALHVLGTMLRTQPEADLFILNDDRGKLSKSNFRQAEISHWVYNMGLAMGRRGWSKIAACAEVFCSLNDYNWDWTLQALGAKCVPGQFTTMVLKGARLFHIGKCGGMHFQKSTDCDSLVRSAQQSLKQAEEAGLLFPDELVVSKVLQKVTIGRPNGGWADARDHKLCLDTANAVIKYQ